MTRLPEWTSHPTDTAADALMRAAWTYRQGEHDRAIDDALIYANWHLDRDVVITELANLAELLSKYEFCGDSPALFAWQEYAQERPGALGSWDDWADAQCEQLLREARALAFRMRHARLVAVVR